MQELLTIACSAAFGSLISLSLIADELERRFRVHQIEGGRGKANRMQSAQSVHPMVNGQPL